MRSVILVAATFLACSVEMVEALTIVLAAAFTRGWHSVRIGIIARSAFSPAVVAVLGPALTLLPLEALRVVVGFLLLSLGLQWLRKALLRAAGYLPLHDEERIFERDVDDGAVNVRSSGPVSTGTPSCCRSRVCSSKGSRSPSSSSRSAPRTTTSRSRSWRGRGARHRRVAGVIVHRPLSRVPENTMKLVVGLMLTTFDLLGCRGRRRSLAGFRPDDPRRACALRRAFVRCRDPNRRGQHGPRRERGRRGCVSSAHFLVRLS